MQQKIIILVFILASRLFAHDPPEIIAILTGQQENQPGFGADFCWIGDQNGDGYDDLLVNDDTFPRDSLSRVYLYHGGEELQNQPAFVFRSAEIGLNFGRQLLYFGEVIPDTPPLFGFLSVIRREDAIIKTELFAGGEELNPNPIFSMSGVNFENAPKIRAGYFKRPFDFNGDGIKDFCFKRDLPGYQLLLQVSFGGAEFDTLSDWSTFVGNSLAYTYGLDINGDSYSDIAPAHAKSILYITRYT